MEQNIQSLFNFIAAAEKSRKYAPNYASGIRTALRLFEKELNEEEKQSIDLFKENFSQIYQQVMRKYQASYTAASLDIYKKRILKVFDDYEKYGKDPTKMIGWTPASHVTKRDKKPLTQVELVRKNDEPVEEVTLVPMTKFQLQLRPGVVANIETPHDMYIEEAKKVRAYIEYLMKNIDPDYKFER